MRIAVRPREAGRTTIREGRGTLPSVVLANAQPVTMRVCGTADGPGRATVRCIATQPAGPLERLVKIRSVANTFTVVLAVDAGLTVIRDAERLPLDPQWVVDLDRARALDRSTAAPELGHWERRAQARSRATSPDDPAARAMFLLLSAGDRARSGSPGLVPVWKLSSPQDWAITADEARRIALSLGADHPFGRFAAGGPFTVGR